MWAASHRDVADVPALQAPMAEFEAFVTSVGESLARAFGPKGKAAGQMRATIRHALVFPTWADLDAQGLDDTAKAALVRSWTAGILARPVGTRSR